MKVILLSATPPPIGGIAIWTVRMLNAKLKNGWVLELVDEKIIGGREVFGDRIKHDYKVEIKRCLKIWKNLHKALKDKDARIVHACIPANTLPVLRECISAIIAKLNKRKFIIHFRCTVPNMIKNRRNKIAVKLLCDLSDCVMVLNETSCEYISTISSTEVQLIPNFVEEAEVKSHHTINNDVKRVLYSGGVIESKGCLDLIEVAKAYPSIEFRLLGKYSTQIADKAKNVSNVFLLGAMEHEYVVKELEQADIFAFLSYFPGEGFSNALAEAMACGVPCLVSDWAANKDMIENKGGVVVPIRNPKKAIEGIAKMMSFDVREKQSEFCLKKVKSSYVANVVIDQYVDCYEHILKK